MLDALMDAGYSLRDAAAALSLSAIDLLDASESAQQPLADFDRFARQVADLQVLDSRMQALKVLVKVCNDATDLEKKRLAAQAILRFDPWRAPRATGRRSAVAENGGRSNPPRSPREVRESYDDTATPLPVPLTPHPLHSGASSCTAPVAHAERTHAPKGHATVARGDEVAPATEEPLDRAPNCFAPKGQANAPEPQASLAACPPFIRSPAHLFTCSPAQPSAAALAAAAGRAISIFAFLPQPARAPPLRAAA